MTAWRSPFAGRDAVVSLAPGRGLDRTLTDISAEHGPVRRRRNPYVGICRTGMGGQSVRWRGTGSSEQAQTHCTEPVTGAMRPGIGNHRLLRMRHARVRTAPRAGASAFIRIATCDAAGSDDGLGDVGVERYQMADKALPANCEDNRAITEQAHCGHERRPQVIESAAHRAAFRMAMRIVMRR